MKSLIESQFGYCLFTWMFCGGKTNARINEDNKRALRIVYRNISIWFDELLKIDKLNNMQHKNVQAIAIKLYKVKNNLSN